MMGMVVMIFLFFIKIFNMFAPQVDNRVFCPYNR